MTHEYKEYVWCTPDAIIRNIFARETNSFLITKDGVKYKKGEFRNGAIAYRTKSGFYYIHSLDCPTVAKYREESRKKNAIYTVKKKLDEMLKGVKTYEQAVEIGRKLGLDL